MSQSEIKLKFADCREFKRKQNVGNTLTTGFSSLERGQTLHARRGLARLVVQVDVESRDEMIDGLLDRRGRRRVGRRTSSTRTRGATPRRLADRRRWCDHVPTGSVEIHAVFVVAFGAQESIVLEVVELGRDRLATRTHTLEALVVIVDLVGDFLVRLAGAERLAASATLGRVLFVALFAHERARLLLNELLAAHRFAALVASQTLRVVVLVLVRGHWRRWQDVFLTLDA